MMYFMIYIGYLIFISTLTFFAYGKDKNYAKKDAWRVKEKSLLSLGIIGGAFGGLTGMYFFHHKTKKIYFLLINLIFSWVHLFLLYRLYHLIAL